MDFMCFSEKIIPSPTALSVLGTALAVGYCNGVPCVYSVSTWSVSWWYRIFSEISLRKRIHFKDSHSISTSLAWATHFYDAVYGRY